MAHYRKLSPVEKNTLLPHLTKATIISGHGINLFLPEYYNISTRRGKHTN